MGYKNQVCGLFIDFLRAVSKYTDNKINEYLKKNAKIVQWIILRNTGTIFW